jgi:hypothetical protein
MTEAPSPDLQAAYEARIEPSVSKQAARLAGALAALAAELPNPWDESTDYFHGFAAVLASDQPLDAAGFRAALGIAARCEISLDRAEPRLTALDAAQASWGDDIAGGFRQLGQLMHAALGELWIAHARCDGAVRVPLWLFGRTGDGALVGLHSISTQT